ncbi:hypothetical protein [Arsenophonus endosymbiont of Bemisia tabaci]|uniref:hypothetical protein n=1 Tax=Arsenophonus endosymbiont of Bemisia tabaci TaxID=536059 RepID=UPI0015F5E9E9|nr:hypothetical protein [Arsenophonus endosymbiont of Bemisia tabaci]
MQFSEAKLWGASESEIAELKKQTKEITDIFATIIVKLTLTMVAAASHQPLAQRN